MKRGIIMFEGYSDVVNIQDVCQMLHISKHTAYLLIQSGQLPAKRIGRIYRIRKTDVCQFMVSA